jgi:hypothetical protein
MQSSPQSASPSVHTNSEDATISRRTEDLIYQAVTVLAAVILLGSLWVF